MLRFCASGYGRIKVKRYDDARSDNSPISVIRTFSVWVASERRLAAHACSNSPPDRYPSDRRVRATSNDQPSTIQRATANGKAHERGHKGIPASMSAIVLLTPTQW